MTNRLPFVALAAALSLSACNQNKEPEVVGGPIDPLANQVANAAPVELPPAITASKSYRCSGDNSVIYIDWLNNGAARVKQSASEPVGTEVPAGSDDLTGDSKAASVTYKGKSCKA